MKIDVNHTLDKLLLQEDTDKDQRITIDDNGLKKFILRNGTDQRVIIEGTYYLSNLLQELFIAKQKNLDYLNIDIDVINEPPVDRISRMIKEHYWQKLTRVLDEKGIEKLIIDSKNNELLTSELRIYVPFKDDIAYNYFKKLETKKLIKVVRLPRQITPEYVLSINKKAGILALNLENENGKIKGSPFVVPGGRFNEMYGWDSYFLSLGLLIDNQLGLAKSMANNFQYQIEHYGKILNANRTYYLTRTQPPFYTSLIQKVYKKTKNKQWLKDHLSTAIKEYFEVWMVQGKRLTETGLNRYFAEGIGMPPETEETNFDIVLKPYAEHLGVSIREYRERYLSRDIENDELDNYFLHDRSLRESGHDTSLRLEGVCASLNTVMLNSLLYKYEMDFAQFIEKDLNNSFQYKTKVFDSAYWLEKAKQRKEKVNAYLWNEDLGIYFDYNFVEERQTSYISGAVFAPLWAGLCSMSQAVDLVKNGLKLLLKNGGIVGSTLKSAGKPNNGMSHRQWDFPYGWAPHQMMLWQGLKNYGFEDELQECVYRWLYTITVNAVNYNGLISEKYNVVTLSHKVLAEYGNVGTDFRYIPNGGFGWTNASFKLGLSFLTEAYIRSLNDLVEPDELFKSKA